MKGIKKIASLLLAVVMVMSIATNVFAQDVNSNAGGSATITIENASKGETYKVVKLFDASVTGNENGSIVYTGNIPESLNEYFMITDGYVVAKESTLSTEAIAAMKAWAETQTPTATALSDGSDLKFTNLLYGYYVITTTQGTAITVDSTNPNATVYDKNSKEPNIIKTVDDADVAIGQTVMYTTVSTTTNYLGTGADSKKVVKYEISDTLPEFLADVTVTSIVVDNDGNAATTDDQVTLAVQRFVDKKISIDWVNEKGDSLYNNGALLIITYTAKVTDKAVIDGTGNKNEVTLQPYVENPDNPDEPKPWDEKWKDEEVIYTYAAALEKVDENKAPLAGAKFAANGLTVEGTKGNYTVVSYAPTSTSLGTVMETDDEGRLIIKGLPSDITLTVTETEAPAGYNKLVATISLKPTKIGEVVTVTTTTVYYDAEGNVTETETENSKITIAYSDKLKEKAIRVVNEKGLELPSTGGMGTTIFYVVGAVLMIGAAVLLITKRRMRSR